MNINSKITEFVINELKKTFSFIDIKSIKLIYESNYNDDIISISFAGSNGVREELFKYQYMTYTSNFIRYNEYDYNRDIIENMICNVKNSEEVINFERQYQSYLQCQQLKTNLIANIEVSKPKTIKI